MSTDSGHTIAIDLMGGDRGADVTLPASFRCAKLNPGIHFKLFGSAKLKSHPVFKLQNVSLVASESDVTMSDLPSNAIRRKRSSSMQLSLNALKNAEANVLVSAGNTGALMAMAYLTLKTIRKVSRPAILSSIPSLTNHHTLVLDVGANASCDPRQLLEFAALGASVALCEGRHNPSVGLLNIGHESHKGHDLIQDAHKILSNNAALNYIGFIEPDKVLEGQVDVVVCDGFSGNIMVKSMEASVSTIAQKIKAVSQKSYLHGIVALLFKLAFKSKLRKLHPENNSHGMLVGLNGMVVKSHGAVSENGFFNAINYSINLLSGPDLKFSCHQFLNES